MTWKELNNANGTSKGTKLPVFTQTGSLILFLVAIAVVNLSHFIAVYEQRQTLSALQAKNKASQTMIDASRTRLHSMKRQFDNIRLPSDGKK
jgi:hypothetical protein